MPNHLLGLYSAFSTLLASSSALCARLYIQLSSSRPLNNRIFAFILTFFHVWWRPVWGNWSSTGTNERSTSDEVRWTGEINLDLGGGLVGPELILWAGDPGFRNSGLLYNLWLGNAFEMILLRIQYDRNRLLNDTSFSHLTSLGNILEPHLPILSFRGCLFT